MLKPKLEIAKPPQPKALKPLHQSRIPKVEALTEALPYMDEADQETYIQVIRDEENLWIAEQVENQAIARENRVIAQENQAITHRRQNPHLYAQETRAMKLSALREYKKELKVWEALPAEERHIICDRCSEEKQALSIHSPICVDCQVEVNTSC